MAASPLSLNVIQIVPPFHSLGFRVHRGNYALGYYLLKRGVSVCFMFWDVQNRLCILIGKGVGRQDCIVCTRVILLVSQATKAQEYMRHEYCFDGQR